MQGRVCDECGKTIKISSFQKNFEEDNWFKICGSIPVFIDICSPECGIKYFQGVIERSK